MASLAAPIISGGVSLISGLMGKNAADRAAKAQQQAAQNAGQGVVDTTGAVRNDILSTAGTAGNSVKATAAQAGTDVKNAAADAAAGVTKSAGDANRLLDPYAGAGSDASETLRAGLAPGGDFNKTPTLADLQIDPGYAFRQQQGEQALERSAAARGGVMGGGFAKDLTNYSQGAASQEYQNAFNRFQTSTQNRFGNLNTVANRGILASGQQGQNDIGAAKYGGDITTNASQYAGNTAIGADQFAGAANINATDLTSQQAIDAARTKGDYLTQGANANASGIVSGSNSLTKGLVGAGNVFSQYLNPKATFADPALNPTNRIAGPRPGSGPSADSSLIH